MKSFFGKAAHHAHRSRGRLRFEDMEPRRMMAVLNVPIRDLGDIVYDGPITIAPEPPPLPAEGSISLDANGVLSIEGSNTHDDTVNIYINHRAGNGAGDLPDLLTISLANINTPLTYAFDPAVVRKIIFHGHGGSDFLDNRTAIPLTAYGEAGNDVLLGGLADDTLIGGDGNDYMDGRRSDDMLFGEAGVDALFGDAGYDSLYG